MGFQQLEIELPPDFSRQELQQEAFRLLGISQGSVTIERQSLDARRRSAIHWKLAVGVSSPELPGTAPDTSAPALQPPRVSGNPRAAVVGSGPAGMFTARLLLEAGWRVTVLERGCEIDQRARKLADFENGGMFPADANYAFGEGGAGSFSDGKLTSRSKHINVERQYVVDTYAQLGKLEEIRYLRHPHLGTDNLRRIVRQMRADFLAQGGEIRFKTRVTGMDTTNGSVRALHCGSEEIAADIVIFACGHAAYDTYRMLMHAGVSFEPKPFAIGCRIEHPQELINLAQWGCVQVPGLKAAEYRLAAGGDGGRGAYTFCMCPGGTVVPAAAFPGRSVVNGMSMYRRNGEFANAALVAAVHLEDILGRAVPAAEALDWVDSLEQRFFEYTGGYQVPACLIKDLGRAKASAPLPRTSFPLGVVQADIRELLPAPVTEKLQAGINVFSRQLRGFEKGVIMGLESKTSAPVRVLREKSGLAHGFHNLYVIGEGSGWAGGIVSSAADGVKSAIAACSEYS